MTAVCMDESVFVYDSVVRRVWAKKGSRPRVMTTGSHKKIFEFGSVTLNEMRRKVSDYYRTRRFTLNIVNHPCPLL